MIALTYVSCATQRFDNNELMTLLNNCHKKNNSLNISGLLIYNGKGTFLQVLEGDQSVITSLYDTIKSDSRHARVTCISQKNISMRDFPDWKMGFRNLENMNLENVSGYSDFMSTDDGEKYLIENASFATSILAHFKNTTNELIF